MTKYKGVEINTKPTDGMKSAARRALEWRKEYGRGGTEVGVARARDIVNGSNLSIDTVKRMYSFFARHEVDKKAEGFSSGEEGFPSAGRIAWDLWGGDGGQTWSKRIVERVKNIDERSYDIIDDIPEEDSEMEELNDEVAIEEAIDIAEERAEPDELSVGDFVSWNTSGGRTRGRITRIVRDGEINVPDSDFTITGTEDDPAALIRIYTDEGEETDTQVGHRFSTLSKIDAIRGFMGDDRKGSVEVQHRSMSLDASPIDEEKRTVKIADRKSVV